MCVCVCVLQIWTIDNNKFYELIYINYQLFSTFLHLQFGMNPRMTSGTFYLKFLKG